MTFLPDPTQPGPAQFELALPEVPAQREVPAQTKPPVQKEAPAQAKPPVQAEAPAQPEATDTSRQEEAQQEAAQQEAAEREAATDTTVGNTGATSTGNATNTRNVTTDGNTGNTGKPENTGDIPNAQNMTAGEITTKDATPAQDAAPAKDTSTQETETDRRAVDATGKPETVGRPETVAKPGPAAKPEIVARPETMARPEIVGGAELIRSARPSACPGLFRIAPGRDGGICRVKLSCGRLTAAQAHAVAHAAPRFGNGVIEITNRANLQLRGVLPGAVDPLVAALMAADLGPQPLSTQQEGPQPESGPISEGGDDIRNVMVNPTFALDPHQLIDMTPLAERLLATLQTNTAYHTLSAKFSLLLDGGESVAMVTHPHDLWLAAYAENGGTTNGGTTNGGMAATHFLLGLAGVPPVAGAAIGIGQTALAAVPVEQGHDLVTATLDLFLELRGEREDISRIRHILAEIGAETFLARLAARLPFPLDRRATIRAWRRTPPAPFGHLGMRPQRRGLPQGHPQDHYRSYYKDRPDLQPDLATVGGLPPLGRLTPRMLHAVADIARELGDGTLRFTPWQSILLPNVTVAASTLVQKRLEAAGLICSSADPLAATIACSGSAGCKAGLAATQQDGLDLADHLRALSHIAPGNMVPGRIFPVHLSGCGKSCAAAAPLPATLVAVAPGRYDLYLHPADLPAADKQSRFGRLLAAAITIDQAAALLAGPPAASTDTTTMNDPIPGGKPHA